MLKNFEFVKIYKIFVKFYESNLGLVKLQFIMVICESQIVIVEVFDDLRNRIQIAMFVNQGCNYRIRYFGFA